MNSETKKALNKIHDAKKKAPLTYYVKLAQDKFSGKATDPYETIIAKRKEKSLDELLVDPSFLEDLHNCLSAWGMNNRAAQLKRFEQFKESILACRSSILELDKGYELDKVGDGQFDEIKRKLKEVFMKLEITENRSKIVSFSKFMHFIFPELIPPMDRGHTANFLDKRFDAPSKEKQFQTFLEMLRVFRELSQSGELKDNFKDAEYNHTIPKYLDNLIIGIQIKRKKVTS